MDPVNMNPNGINPLTGIGAADGRGADVVGADGAGGFRDILMNHLQDVNRMQVEADQAVQDLVTGKTENLHQVIAAVNEASLSFQLMMAVRDKLVDAYKEVMRMQV